jgi:methyltransferase (TIGR00027 family)
MRDRPSATAENIALVRAHLTRLGLLDDVYAARFLRLSRRAVYRLIARWQATGLGRRAVYGLLARTRFFDELVRCGIEEGIRQIVIVGAGYDARAWRLATPGVRFFEIDHPATQARKRALAPDGGPTFLAADLAVESIEDVLQRAGVSSADPAVVLCEGLTHYFDESGVRRLLGSIAHRRCVGTVLGVDFGVRLEDQQRLLRAVLGVQRAILALRGEPILFALNAGDVPVFLESLGWSGVEVVTGRQLHKRFLAGTPLSKASDALGAYFASAVIE